MTNVLKIIDQIIALNQAAIDINNSIKLAQQVLKNSQIEKRDVTDAELQMFLEKDNQKKDELNKLISQR